MDLLEYQAKELFEQVGIPVLPSQPIHDPTEIKRLQIPYPVVLKSQVSVGGRGKAGGIRFVENTIDAIAAARTIFNLPILGQYPHVLLAEARYDAQQEFFLAIVLDYQLQRPILLGSITGGIHVEKLLANLQTVVVEEDFSPFYARRLMVKMGLKDQLIESVSTIVEKMYHLFQEKDLDLIEINPLGVNANGQLMALDGKITVNEAALPRHPEILSLSLPPQQETTIKSSLNSDLIPLSKSIDNIDKKGNIAIVTNSLNLALMSWDLISQAKGKPAVCTVVGQGINCQLLSDSLLSQQLEKALTEIITIKKIKIILVNILGSPKTSETVAEKICSYLQPPVETATEDRRERPTGTISRPRRKSNLKSRSQTEPSLQPPQFVVRLIGGKIEEIRETLDTMAVYWTENLGEAIDKIISLA